MALILKDRVKETTTTTGTGDFSLGGADSTFEAFSSYMANGDTTYYAIATQESGVDEWEVGIGTWNTGNTLSRTTILAGSNGTSAVNFGTGDKSVFMSYPASKAVYLDGNGDIDINGGTIDGTTVGANNATSGKFTTLETTSNADIGGYIDLEVLSNHAAFQEGRIWYDSIHKTVNFYSDDQNVIHELGIEEHQRVYNATGSTILKGKPLYFSGNYTAGTIDVPTVGLADATDVNAYNAQGLAASDIPNNSYGYCIIAGQLDGFDTSGLTAGTNFFVGLTPGAVQNASPLYPNFPMCLGWVVNSDATDGTVLVNQQNHSVTSFRVRTSAHVGADLQVDGNLTVLGSTTSVSTSDVTAGAPFYRANEGDAIGEAGTTFTGTGLDDAFFAGHFTGTTSTTYYVKIDGVGTGTGGVDTFAWSTDNFVTSVATAVDITGNEQLIHSADNISVTFSSTTGHTLNDQWNGTASPVNVDSGFFTNYNTGTSGVGYTHTGFYYDASEGKWILLDEYDPTPAGAIDLAHASVSYAILKADSFEGSLTGSVTGNVTGTATSATALATARNIGGVSFNGTANIDLPGVNIAGNQDTTGNADTATALATSRTIQLTGDVVGSVTFDGSADVSINAVVQDDSHSHVISNVDGLQTALDAKVDNTTTITSGNYLTGGGDLSVNRTLDVDATSLNTASKVVARDSSGNFSAGTITAALSGNATTASSLATARNIAVTGAVTGNANFDGSGNISISTTATSDPTVTLTGAVTGSGTMTNLGNVSIATTATADPTLTLSGDASGSATFTNLSNATLSVTVADDSHNHVISNVDGLQTALNAKYDASNPNGYTTYTANQSLNTSNSPSFAGVNINGNLNAVDNIYLAGVLYHEGDTDTRLWFDTDTLALRTGGTDRVYINNAGVRIGDTGNGYFRPVSGNYGSIEIDGGAHGGWEGYSIGGHSVFMSNGSTTGLYNDTNNEWLVECVHNGSVYLRYNGTNRFETTNAGAQVNGDLTVTGGDISLSGTGRIQGVDTVSSGTDAANKIYVDNAVASAGGDEQTATTTSTSQTAIATYTASSSLGLEITVIATNTVTTERTISKLLVTHDNTTAVATEYGTVNTDATIATFDVDISGGNVRLLATAASTNSTNYTAKAVILA